MSEMGTDLYRWLMSESANNQDGGELEYKIWSPTPWMVDVFTGQISNSGRFREIMEWCREKFGPESLPIHGKEGVWRSSSATVYGWTWMGFDTQERMKEFLQVWGNSKEAAAAAGYLDVPGVIRSRDD